MFDVNIGESVLFSALVAGSLVKLSSLYMLHKNRIKNAPIVGKVSGLFIYPIKSCKGIKVEQAEVTWEGLKWNGIIDRHWMLMNAEGKFVSARIEPSLVLVEPSIQGDTMYINAPGMPTIKIPTHPSIEGATCYQTKIFDHSVRGMCCGQEVADWFSKFLNKSVRLLYLHPKIGPSTVLDGGSKFDKMARPWDKVGFANKVAYNMLSDASVTDLNKHLDDKQVSVENFRPNIHATGCKPYDEVGYADYGPYMFISEESLQDLNSHLENPISMDRFRTNITVSDVSKAYDEDTWRTAFIDGTQFTYLKEGMRCVVTTVDPVKGEKDKEEQPLKMLRSYRLKPDVYGNAPLFGINMVPDSLGTIRIGDAIRAYTSLD